MSGGHFEYIQHRMEDAADELRRLSKRGGYPDDIRASFAESARAVSEAATRLHRADYLLCGDDGEDSYRRRLAEDLGRLKSGDA